MADVVIAGCSRPTRPACASWTAGCARWAGPPPRSSRGEALWDLLEGAVRARGIEVRYRCAAERLLLGPDGSVTGVTAGRTAQPATGGVILACGGFEAEPALADTYLPFGPSWPVGHPGNTGAGLVMAQQAGAAQWHMYGCFGWFAFRTPDFPALFAVDFFGASHISARC